MLCQQIQRHSCEPGQLLLYHVGHAHRLHLSSGPKRHRIVQQLAERRTGQYRPVTGQA